MSPKPASVYEIVLNMHTLTKLIKLNVIILISDDSSSCKLVGLKSELRACGGR